MKKIFLLVIGITTTLCAANGPTEEKDNKASEKASHPKCSEPWLQKDCGCNDSWMKDQCDQTDTFGIPVDQSQEEDEQQLEMGEKYHKKEKHKEAASSPEKSK